MGADACFDADGAPKNEALNGDTKVLQSSPESTRPQSRRLSVFYDVFIVLIYTFNSILSLRWCAGTQPLARRSQPTVALVHYGREGQPTVAPTPHGKRAYRSAPTVAPVWRVCYM